MAQGTFKQQLQAKQQMQTSSRLTRTQRVQQKYELDKQRKAQEDAYYSSPEYIQYQQQQAEIKKQQEGVQDLKNQIDYWQKRYDEAKAGRQRLEQEGLSSSEKAEYNRLDDEMGNSAWRITYYKEALGKAEQGYDAQQLKQQAEARADYRENNPRMTEAEKQKNQTIRYQNQLLKWSDKAGFVNLPEVIQEKINPEAVAWQKQNPTEKLIFDNYGNIKGVESGSLGKTYGIEEYNKEVQRLQEVSPEERYYNEKTGEITKEKYIPMNNEGKPISELAPQQLKIYTTPKGEPIKDIEKYIQENRIPIPQSEKIKSPEEFKKSLVPTYDIKSLVAKTQTKLDYTQIAQWDEKTSKVEILGSGAVGSAEEVVTTLAMGGTGFIKGGLITGAKILLWKPITQTAEAGKNFLFPTSDKSILSQIGRGVYNAGTLPFTALSYGTGLTQSFVPHPIKTTKELGKSIWENKIETITTIGLTPVFTKLYSTSIFGEKPYQMKPTKQMIKDVEPFTRKRVTLLLKNEQGEYILGKTQSGEIISIGGGIEEGQSIMKALKMELKQETGLSLKDIEDLKFFKKVVFPEETHYTFTGTLKSGAKIIPSSDITKIVTISPSNLFIKGVTGQTSLQPIARFSLFPFGRIRSYEAGIINYLERGVKPTWLAIDTKYGSYFLGTQSRYNVPYTQQSKFLKQEELLLAHGTPSGTLLRRYSLWEKKLTIEASATKRGQMQGLYVQPPSNVGGKQFGYIGLSYLGFKTSQPFSYTGIKLGLPKRVALLFKEKPSKALAETPKTLSGMEEELIIVPKTTIRTVGRASVSSIGLQRVYLQLSKITGFGKGGKVNSQVTSSLGDSNLYLPESVLIAPFVSKSQTSSLKKSISSLIGYSKPSKMSKVSEVSQISKKSLISEPSNLKMSSLMSKINRISENYIIPSKPSLIETSTTFKYKPFKYSVSESGLYEKVKKKMKKRRRFPETLGLFPDFTSRIVGLEPQEVSMKDVNKALKKIKTGFEVRTGGRIKGFKNVQEKQLLAGIMK